MLKQSIEFTAENINEILANINLNEMQLELFHKEIIEHCKNMDYYDQQRIIDEFNKHGTAIKHILKKGKILKSNPTRKRGVSYRVKQKDDLINEIIAFNTGYGGFDYDELSALSRYTLLKIRDNFSIGK